MTGGILGTAGSDEKIVIGGEGINITWFEGKGGALLEGKRS